MRARRIDDELNLTSGETLSLSIISYGRSAWGVLSSVVNEIYGAFASCTVGCMETQNDGEQYLSGSAVIYDSLGESDEDGVVVPGINGLTRRVPTVGQSDDERPSGDALGCGDVYAVSPRAKGDDKDRKID